MECVRERERERRRGREGGRERWGKEGDLSVIVLCCVQTEGGRDRWFNVFRM